MSQVLRSSFWHGSPISSDCFKYEGTSNLFSVIIFFYWNWSSTIFSKECWLSIFDFCMYFLSFHVVCVQLSGYSLVCTFGIVTSFWQNAIYVVLSNVTPYPGILIVFSVLLAIGSNSCLLKWVFSYFQDIFDYDSVNNRHKCQSIVCLATKIYL